MIRKATYLDVPDIIRMSKEFYALTHYPDFAPYDEDTSELLAQGLVDNHILFVAELNGKVCGMVGAVVMPWLFNRYVLTAHEVIWWIDENARGSKLGLELLKLVEKAAYEMGAKAIQMPHFVKYPYAAKLYEAAGYEHTESIYMKRF